MRTLALAATLCLFTAGCLVPDEDPPEDDGDEGGDGGTPTLQALYLKPGHRLDDAPPASAAPHAEPAYPTKNAYVNEDLEVFTSAPLTGLHVTELRLVIYYEVDRPTVDAFTNDSDAAASMHYAFWVGSDSIYPAYSPAYGETVLTPGTTYEATVQFPLPPGGWTVPPNETLQLLIAPLLLNDEAGNLHYLVDHGSTPSRLELLASPWTDSEPSLENIDLHPQTVAGNSGMFTGLTGGDEKSQVLLDIELGDNESFLRIDVDWKSTAAGKSDLDLTLYDAVGAVVATSTTPYQNETIRLFPPQLDALGRGRFVAEVNVYSGAQTVFDVVVSKGSSADE